MSKSQFRCSPDSRARGTRRLLTLSALLFTFVLTVGIAPTVLAQHGHREPAARDSVRVDSAARRAAGPAHDSVAGMGGMSMAGTGDMHGMQNMMEGPLGISHERLGSGTSWMPDSSPMHANHKMWGDWTVMLHGVAFGQFDDQGSKRGDRQFGIVDWEMLMAMRKIGTGQLHLHTMVSLEPLTLGARGYPLLLQTGESYKGQPLHDRQHPHDAFMEVAAIFDQPIASNLALELYGGPAGEPALGPVAFMHRPSAQSDPLAPLGHHWQDATHISFGVVTAGLYSRLWKLEGSWFNGREPDENRWDFDLRRFDSWSGRLTVNPTGRLSFAGWYGWLPSPEALHPEESVHRYGASMLYGGRGVRGGALATSLIWGANAIAGTIENSVAAESNLEIGQKNTVFSRAEYVRKSAEDLVLPAIDPHREFDLGSLVLGYVREVAPIRGGTIGVGGRATMNFVPATVGTFYGTRTPMGFDVYVRIRPKKMSSHEAMPMADHGAADHAMPGGMRGMPGMPPAGHGQPMPMISDSQPTRRDSMPGMAPMRGMPGMSMPNDTGRGIMKDSTNQHLRHDMMSAMPGMRSRTVRDSTTESQHPRGGAAAPSRDNRAYAAPGKSRSASSAKRAARKRAPSSAKKTSRKAHEMPPMPGMKMPMDTTRARKP